MVQPQPGAVTFLTSALARLDHLLGERPGRLRTRHLVRHAEVRKTVERARDRLRQLGEPGMNLALVQEQLPPLLAASPWLSAGETPQKPTPEQAWALADGLRALWISAAPPQALLPYVDTHPVGGIDAAALGADDLRHRLLQAQDVLRARGAHDRARTSLRQHYLQRVGNVLWVLLLVALVVSALVFDEPGTVLLSALAGAVGGTLSGARTLRGATDIREARAFQAWWWVQPAVGGAVGLFIYALLTSGVLSLPGSTATDDAPRAAAFVVYAFAAGFSEPFVLGVLNRITGAADAVADATANPPRAPVEPPASSEPPPARAPVPAGGATRHGP